MKQFNLEEYLNNLRKGINTRKMSFRHFQIFGATERGVALGFYMVMLKCL